MRSKDQGLACGSGGELLPPRPTGASGLGSLRLGPPSLTATLTGKDLASQCQARAPSSASPAESGVEERGEGACRLLSVTSPLPEGLWGQGAAPSACSGEALHLPGWVWVKCWVFHFLAVDSFSPSWLIFSFVASAPSGSAVGFCPHSSSRLKPHSPLHILSHLLVPSSVLQRPGATLPPKFSLACHPLPQPFSPLSSSLSFQEYAISQKVPFSQPWLFSCVSLVLTSQRNV